MHFSGCANKRKYKSVLPSRSEILHYSHGSKDYLVIQKVFELKYKFWNMKCHKSQKIYESFENINVIIIISFWSHYDLTIVISINSCLVLSCGYIQEMVISILYASHIYYEKFITLDTYVVHLWYNKLRTCSMALVRAFFSSFFFGFILFTD